MRTAAAAAAAEGCCLRNGESSFRHKKYLKGEIMPARNGQNPIRAVKDFAHGVNKGEAQSMHGKQVNMVCPSCKTEVPPKPGFRPSSIKCPKCGSSMSK